MSAKYNIAEWSSSVARRAHNPKVVGSNPASATTFLKPFDLFQTAFSPNAAVVESADTRDLKSLGLTSVPVQVRLAAPTLKRRIYAVWGIFYV